MSTPTQFPAGQPGPIPGYDPSGFPQPPQKKEKNVLGIIALVCSVLGLILSCVKGALILGWILLPIGFILGIVAAVQKNKPHGVGIAAIVVSAVGTVVAIAMFILVVGNAFSDAFDTTTSSSSSDSEAKGLLSNSGSSDAGSSRDNPLPIGSTIEDDEWAYTINSVTLNATDQVMAANSFNDEPKPGMEYIIVNVTITYKGNDAQGATPFGQVRYVSAEGNTYSSADDFAVAEDNLDTLTTLFQGASISGNEVMSAPIDTADQGVLAVTPSVLSDAKFVAVQ